ncbi:hypothetical protein J2X61_006131 [Bacillus sp. 3255]|nr:hypothetical protein [Bacillus sp. 3255]
MVSLKKARSLDDVKDRTYTNYLFGHHGQPGMHVYVRAMSIRSSKEAVRFSVHRVIEVTLFNIFIVDKGGGFLMETTGTQSFAKR